MAKESTTIDKELYEGLQQARKKKPRYFAVIGKGPDVVGMIVQKKVISAGLVQKAKSEFKGNLVVEGVCRGEGAELIFEVVGEEPSILPKKLKDFIVERTELTLKAQWATVPQLSAVVDEEATPPAAEVPPAPPPTATAPPIPPPPPPPPGPVPPQPTVAPGLDAKSLQARLMALVLRQKAVVAQTPAVRDFLNTITKPTADLVTKVSPESPAALDKLEKALAGAEQWSAELTRVDPLYQQFLLTNPPNGAKVRDVMTMCLQQAGTGAYDKATVGLQKLAPVLQAGKTPATPTETSTPPVQQQATQQPPEQASAAATDWKTARQAWQDANDDVNDQINGLRKALLDRAKEPGEDEGMEDLAEALGEIAGNGLNAITEDHRVKLMAAVMEVADGSPAAMQKFGAKALGLITNFQEFLATSEKIEVCDDNPFEAPVSIRATLTPPLSQMAAAIQAAIGK